MKDRGAKGELANVLQYKFLGIFPQFFFQLQKCHSFRKFIQFGAFCLGVCGMVRMVIVYKRTKRDGMMRIFFVEHSKLNFIPKGCKCGIPFEYLRYLIPCLI